MAVKSWNTVAIIGVGLLGGSVGLALHQRGLATRIIGIGRNLERLRKARELGAVTEITSVVGQGVRDANLIVICTPIEDIAAKIREVRRYCLADAFITDVGSTKTSIVAAVEQQSQERGAGNLSGTFIGSHPIAGSEKTGVENSRDDLFVDRAVIITPRAADLEANVATIESLWQSLGAYVFRMSAQEHDEAVAAISHLPHAVASLLSALTPAKYLPLVAGGWLDSTRIAAGDVELWRQIMSDNRYELEKQLAQFALGIQAFRNALAQNDTNEIVRILLAGKINRDAVGN